MIYSELLAEATSRANSPEGMAKLVASLLWQLPSNHPLLREFRTRLANYVYVKRVAKIYKKRGIALQEKVRKGIYFNSWDVECEKAHVEEIETHLIADLGQEAVQKLKKQIGQECQFLVRRRWMGNT